MLTHKSMPLAPGLGLRACWHCLKRSWRAGHCRAALRQEAVSLLQTTSSAGYSRGFRALCRCTGLFRCPPSADCMARALLHGEHRQPLLQEIILLVRGDAIGLDLPFVQCPGFCRAKGEWCQNPPSSASSPNDEFLCCYLQECLLQYLQNLTKSLPTLSFIFVITFQFQLTIS